MSEIMVDNYTRRGLFNHLLTHNGRALCAHEEMSALFDTIQKRQLELSGERQLYCRLYDAGKWTNVTGVLSYSVMHTSSISHVFLQVIKNKKANNSWTRSAYVLLVFCNRYPSYSGYILH